SCARLRYAMPCCVRTYQRVKPSILRARRRAIPQVSHANVDIQCADAIGLCHASPVA
ncbi:hypothetical protein HAX54_035393, partial [Datura stramonium]|nr:hypothetical protein [Datura stramonium]